MKKNVLLIVIILMKFTNTFSQITLSHTYTTDLPDRSVKLSLSGLKYVHVHEVGPTITYFRLYNPDNSIFKTVTLPAWSGKNVMNVEFISETLFDQDTLIEFYAGYSNGIVNSMRICNENGLILLQRDTANIAGSFVGVSEQGFIPGGVFPDGNASKLMVAKGYGASATIEIYDLPGQLACLECSNGVISGLIQPPNSTVQDRASIASPNPFIDFVKIKYSLPANTKHAFVNLLDIRGILIKKKEIDSHFDEVVITSDEIKQGVYIYQIVADNVVITNNKIIKL